ncbi:hypothetical protein BGZ82_002809, partial [Podila clonocystis]
MSNKRNRTEPSGSVMTLLDREQAKFDTLFAAVNEEHSRIFDSPDFIHWPTSSILPYLSSQDISGPLISTAKGAVTISRPQLEFQVLVKSTLTTTGEGRYLCVEQLPFSFESAADIVAIQAELSSEGNGYKSDGFKTMRITHAKKNNYMDMTCYDKAATRI